MCACIVQFCLERMSHDAKEEYFQNIAECQKKLCEINQKLLEIKKKHIRMKEIYPNKYGKKQCAQLEENHSILTKEAELLERDIAFATSMLDSVNDSFTTKLMKKVLPGKMFYSFARETSKEFKVSLMSHSTNFLERKVMSLESLTKRPRKKKIEEKKIGHEVEAGGSSSSCKSDMNMKKEEAGKHEFSPSKERQFQDLEIRNVKYDDEHVAFYSDTYTEPSVYALDILKKQKGKNKTHKKRHPENEIRSAEKCAQTENTDYFSKNSSIESLEKSIQTEEFQQTYAMPEIYEALKKIIEECVPCERVEQNSDIEEDSGSLYFTEWAREQNNSTDQSLELVTAMNEVMLPSVWSCLQHKNHQFPITPYPQCTDTDKLSNFNEDIVCLAGIQEGVQYSCYLPKQLVGQRKVIGQRYLLSLNRFIPDIWFVKESLCVLCILEYGYPNVLEMKSLDVSPGSTNCNGVAVQVVRKRSKHEPIQSTLQIDYCNNSETSGRIVLTEFGNDECIQSEIFGRIVTYLLGLKSSADKT